MSRAEFSGRFGFIMSAAGAAVGLGNLWRFPYYAARYGGGTFLLTYLFFAVTFGIVLLAFEVALGRSTGKGVIGSYQGKGWPLAGFFTAIIPMLVLPYYCIVGGWVIKYALLFLFNRQDITAAPNFFVNFSNSFGEPLLLLLVFVSISIAIAMTGLTHGIEKANKILMPLLIVITLGIAMFVISQPMMQSGIKYYLLPSASEISFDLILAALTQLFYSLSIGMGIMITYGSYMPHYIDIKNSALQIMLCDTFVAFVSGLMIVPAVASAGMQEVKNAGASLMFVTLPHVLQIMFCGRWIGLAFFILVFLAALTSVISFVETMVVNMSELFNWSRAWALQMIFAITAVTGFLCQYTKMNGGYDLTDILDKVANHIFIPMGALLLCLYVQKEQRMETLLREIGVTGNFNVWFRIFMRYVAPFVILLILVAVWLH